MPKPTRKDSTIACIKAIGYVEDHNAVSTKFRVFKSPHSSERLLVGKSGALRRTKTTIADSRTLTDSRTHEALAYVGGLILGGWKHPSPLEVIRAILAGQIKPQ